jgi:dTDP-glucose 4,6-dehydratase/UDP-glucose 4-epimerase
VSRCYLVTGGTGFLGAALVRRLVAEGHRVRVLDNQFRGATARLGAALNAVELVEADIRDTAAVKRAAAGVDAIAHLAFINGTEFFYSHPELVLDVGIRGMLNVIDAARANGVRELCVASSSEVYQTPPTVPTDERVPLSIPDVLNPRYSYGGGKLLCELMALNYGRSGFDRVTVFRPHNVYGPDMGWEHVLPQFVLRAVDAIAATPSGPVPFPIQGDGSQTRAFVHVDDFTDGLMQVLARGEHLNVYHIGNPEEVTIARVVELVMARFGRAARMIASPAPPGGTPRRCPDIGKLAALGYAPRIPLAVGLPSLIDWYTANHHRRPRRSA